MKMKICEPSNEDVSYMPSPNNTSMSPCSIRESLNFTHINNQNSMCTAIYFVEESVQVWLNFVNLFLKVAD